MVGGGCAFSTSSLERLIGKQGRLCQGQLELARCHFKLEAFQLISSRTHKALLYRHTASWHKVYLQPTVGHLSLPSADTLPQSLPNYSHLSWLFFCGGKLMWCVHNSSENQMVMSSTPFRNEDSLQESERMDNHGLQAPKFVPTQLHPLVTPECL